MKETIRKQDDRNQNLVLFLFFIIFIIKSVFIIFDFAPVSASEKSGIAIRYELDYQPHKMFDVFLTFHKAELLVI